MSRTVISGFFATGIFVGVLVCLRVGWRLGRRRLGAQGEGGQAGLGAVEGAVYGLMGLLIAFTFTGAAGRFEQRRQLITQQVNAIGTAWLRLDLVGEPARSDLQALFRRYVETQLEVVQDVSDRAATSSALVRLGELQQRIWTQAIEAVRTDKAQPLAQTLLPPLNEMFDLATSRVLVSRQHPPMAIFLMLGLLVLVSALMGGYGMAKAESQSLLHVLGFAVILGLSVYLILDLEFPRLGLLRIDPFDQALSELRASMD